ncbi:YraN family protein [Neptunitalea lumnitzerae]|uniref:UPF0102 protein Y10_07330 n=1 Tax=Neptunitalea lumnitzerae TaxID=2965509 RepID=A0ABQ5MH60_9FLAO|nr:YraN family protein [Neptunitalea sp. Y10]GLB48365.1 UPF0102 protein [Neptunitalea sp. Y10]
MADHNDFGKEAEEKAVRHLKSSGYEILAQNYYYRKAEIDILAFKNNTLIVVEVKARKNAYFGNPEQAVNKKKIRLLMEAVNNYIDLNDLDAEVRFDIIAILRQKEGFYVNHIEDAFYFF